MSKQSRLAVLRMVGTLLLLLSAVVCPALAAEEAGQGAAVLTQPGFEGTKKVGLKCKDAHRAKAKGAWKGNWTITLATSEG